MNAPVPSPDAIETRDKAVPAPVEAGVVEFRYADFRFSWWFVVVFAGLGWAAFGVDPPLVSPMFLLFAGTVAFAVVRYTRERFRHAGPWLVLDPEGLHWTPYEQARPDVRWDDIERLTWGRERSGEYIGIRLKDPARRLPAGSLWMYGKRQAHLRIRVANPERSAEWLVDCIVDYHARLGR